MSIVSRQRNMVRELLLVLACLAVVMVLGVAHSNAQVRAGTTYQIQRDSINSGGGASAGTTYNLNSTVGQIGSGASAGGTYNLSVSGYQQTDAICNDGIDNDGDGLVDFPNDPGCDSVTDDDETNSTGGGGGSGGGSTCSIDVTPTTISPGEVATLSWDAQSSSYASSGSHSIVPDVGAIVGREGSVDVSPSSTTTYKATFEKLSGSTYDCDVTLEVEGGGSFVKFASPTFSVTEAGGIVSIIVEREGDTSGPASVSILTTQNSAIDGADYTGGTATVNWPAGDATAKIATFPIIDDLEFEPVSETFSVLLFSPSGAALGSPFFATVVILDNETDAPTTTTLTVRKDVINDGGGAASAGDFDLLVDGVVYSSGSTIPVTPGDTVTVSELPITGYDFVSITGNTSCPDVLGGSVTLSAGQNITCVITNDDVGGPPTTPDPGPDPDPDPGAPDGPGGSANNQIQFVTDSYRVLEDEGQVVVQLIRRGSPVGQVDALIQHINGTALSNIDFVGINQVLSWQDGEGGIKTLTVPLISDNVVESDESFSLVISEVDGAGVGRIDRTIVQVDDGEIVPSPDTDGPPTCIGDQCPGGIIEQVLPVAERVVNSPTAVAVNGLVVLGLLTNGIGAAFSFASPVALAELTLAPFRLWSLLLTLLGIKKRGRPWGTVYDARTKQPLDPVYVVLRDLAGNEVATTITDIDGRYGFFVDKGEYYIQAVKTHYSFPSTHLQGRQSDELYDDLYFGEVIVVEEDNQVIQHSIPMDPVGFDWNEYAKSKDSRFMRYFSKNTVFLSRLVNTLFYLGFLFSAFAVFVTPGVYNIVVFSLYLLMMILRVIGIQSKALGGIYLDDVPLPFAIVRIKSADLKYEYMRRIADRYGRYYALVQKGEYRIVIEQKLDDGSYEHIYTSEPMRIKKGILHKSFNIAAVDRDEEDEE